MRRRLADESGNTIVEMLFVMVLLAIIMTGVINVFVSGTRAGADANGRLEAQQNTRIAFARLEYEVRCSSSATILSSGAGVKLTMNTACSHATGTIAWCVTSGALTRYVSSTCSGTAITYVRNITTATPFSCVAPIGPLPKVQVSMTVNTTGRSSDAVQALDAITMRNASPTTSTTTNCS